MLNSLGQPQQEEQVPDADNTDDFDETSSDASGYWSSYYASSFAGGNGTTSEYLISTAEQLARLAYLTNSSTYASTYCSKYYKLTADIDISAHYWIPIGLKYAFTGRFDGDGHVISGLTMSFTSTTVSYYSGVDSKYYGGLFGRIDTKGASVEIKDFVMRNVSVTTASATSPFGTSGTYIGAVVGYVSPTVVYPLYFSRIGINYGDMTFSYTSYSSAVFCVGGLIGKIENPAGSAISIERCFNYMRIYTSSSGTSADKLYVGGLVGWIYSSTTSTTSTTLILLENSYFNGYMACFVGNTVGGIVGICTGADITIQKCYFHNNASVAYVGNAFGGGIAGSAVYCKIYSCFTDAAIQLYNAASSHAYGAIAGFSWGMTCLSCSWYSTNTTNITGGNATLTNNTAYTSSTLPISSAGSAFYTSTSYLAQSGTSYAWSISTATTSVSSSYVWAKYVGSSTALNAGLPVLYWSLKYVRAYRYTNASASNTTYAYLQYQKGSTYEYASNDTTTTAYSKYCLIGQTIKLSLGTSSTVTGWKFARWNVSQTTTPTTTSLSTATSFTTFVSGLNDVTISTSNYYHYYYAVYERESYEININVNDPNGTEVYEQAGVFTAYYSFNDTTYSNMGNEPLVNGSSLKVPYESTIKISNIVPTADYKLKSVTVSGTGTLVDNGGGVYTFTVGAGTATINIDMDYDYSVVNFGGTNIAIADGAFYGKANGNNVTVSYSNYIDAGGQVCSDVTITAVSWVSEYTGCYFGMAEKLTPGVEYVWSIDLKASRSISLSHIGHEQGGQLENLTIDTSWQTFTHRFIANSSTASAFVLYSPSFETGDIVNITNFTLQRAEDVTSDSAMPSRVYTANGTYANLPTPTKAGYVFKGWYTGKNGGGIKVNNDDKLAFKFDHILYPYFVYDSDNQLKYDAFEDYFYFEDGEYPQSDVDVKIDSFDNVKTQVGELSISYDMQTNTATLNGTLGAGENAMFLFAKSSNTILPSSHFTINLKHLSGSVSGDTSKLLTAMGLYADKNYSQLLRTARLQFGLDEISDFVDTVQDSCSIGVGLDNSWFSSATDIVFSNYKFQFEVAFDYSFLLNLCLSNDILEQVYEIKYLDADLKETSMPVYEFEGKRYALATAGGTSKWFMVEPIRWRVDVESPTEFDGTNFVNLGRGSMYEDKITVNLWAYMDNWADFNGSKMSLISCTEGGGWVIGNDANPTVIDIVAYDSGLNGYRRAVSSVTYASLSSGWHMFTMTFDGSYLRTYLDGNFLTSSDKFTGKLQYHATNSIFVGAEAGSSATIPGGYFFQGKMKNWSIVHEAYSADKISRLFDTMNGDYAGFENYGDYNTNFTVVSADVLGFGAVTASHAKEGWSYVQTDSVDLTNINTRGAEMSRFMQELSVQDMNLQYSASQTISYDKFGDGGNFNTTNRVEVATDGIRVASVEEIETIAGAKAKASDLVAFLSSGGQTADGGDYVDYWTRNLGEQLDTAKMVSSVGTISDAWLQNAMGARFAMTMSEGISMLATSSNQVTFTTAGGYEILGQSVAVTANEDYALKVKVEAPKFVGQLKVQALNAAPTDGDNAESVLAEQTIASGQNGDIVLSFNSGSAQSVWLVVNGGLMGDGQIVTIKFTGWNLIENGSVVAEFDSNMRNWTEYFHSDSIDVDKNLYLPREFRNFNSLLSLDTETNIFSINYTNTGSGTDWVNFMTYFDNNPYIKTSTTYTAVLEVFDFKTLSSGSIRLFSPYEEGSASNVDVSTDSISFNNISGNGIYTFTFTTASSFASCIYNFRSYISVGAGQTANLKFRISLFEGTPTIGDDFVYQAPSGRGFDNLIIGQLADAGSVENNNMTIAYNKSTGVYTLTPSSATSPYASVSGQYVDLEENKTYAVHVDVRSGSDSATAVYSSIGGIYLGIDYGYSDASAVHIQSITGEATRTFTVSETGRYNIRFDSNSSTTKYIHNFWIKEVNETAVGYVDYLDNFSVETTSGNRRIAPNTGFGGSVFHVGTRVFLQAKFTGSLTHVDVNDVLLTENRDYFIRDCGSYKLVTIDYVITNTNYIGTYSFIDIENTTAQVLQFEVCVLDEYSSLYINCQGGWEIIGQQLEVTANTNYTLEVDYVMPSYTVLTDAGHSGLIGLACIVSSVAPTNGDMVENKLERFQFAPSTSGHMTITFNTGSNTTIWIVLNGGYVADGQTVRFHFKDWKLTAGGYDVTTFNKHMGTWTKYFYGENMSVISGGLVTYTQIDYIESTGTQYIDTGVIARSGLTVNVDFMLNQVTSSGSTDLLAAANGSGNKFYIFHQYYGTCGLGYNAYESSTFTPSANTRYVCETSLNQNSQYFKINGTTYSTATHTTAYNLGVTMYMFGRNNNGTFDYGVSARIYACKMWQGDTLVRDFVPCIRDTDGAVGMYDKVSGQFFGNAGTGRFFTPKETLSTNSYSGSGAGLTVDFNAYTNRLTLNGTMTSSFYFPDGVLKWNAGTDIVNFKAGQQYVVSVKLISGTVNNPNGGSFCLETYTSSDQGLGGYGERNYVDLGFSYRVERLTINSTAETNGAYFKFWIWPGSGTLASFNNAVFEITVSRGW